MEFLWAPYESPIGTLALVAKSGKIRQLRFPERVGGLDRERRRPEELGQAIAQLDAYFAGERRSFELPLELLGTPFQRAVWAELRRIPYGTTVSYGELAGRIGRPGEAREVGAAVGRTPVPILVPCHRVIGANGALVGYGGGLERKRTLLELEGRVAAGLPPEPAWAYEQLALG